MGLLIGASILTVLEVLDLFVYNLLMKCLNRRNRNKRKEIEAN